MDPEDLNERLSRIQTQWTLVFQAHQGPLDATTSAFQKLLLRYYGAVYRYLLGILRDPGAAEELTQEFALRFLRGDFHRADPQRGRFRDFVKTAVRHLALDYWKQKDKQKEKGPRPLPEDESHFLAGPSAGSHFDREFTTNWREELLTHTWEALQDFQEKTGQLYHTVLRLKTEHPEMRSAQLVKNLRILLRKTLTEEAVRQLLHRARSKFADLLVEEVSHSLQTPDREELEQELIELNLLSYCQAALERWNPARE
jgi:RNA polymerase sigma-70 factor (ECF subfamily)